MKKGVGTIITGVVLFVLGVVVVPAVILLPLILNESKTRQFLVPGSMEVAIEKPGRYYLWNDFQTIFDGRTYSVPEELPGGLEIAITNASGNRLTFVSDGSTSSTGGTSSKRSIGYVEVAGPGRLTVAVSGEADERVFSFAQSNIIKILGMAFGGMGVSVLMVLAGIAISIVGLVRLSSNSSPSPPGGPPSV